MSNMNKHKGFYVFYPSEYFYERGILGNKTNDAQESQKNETKKTPDWFKSLYKIEQSFYGVENIEPLRQEYRKNMRKIRSNEMDRIIEECNMAKRILETGLQDLHNFADNSMRIPTLIISLSSFIISVLSFSGAGPAQGTYVAYASAAILFIGIIVYLNIAFSSSDSKLVEYYQQAIRCFDIFQSIICEKRDMNNLIAES